MASQIIDRSFKLAMHAASVESIEVFETTISRLRTLDRHNEIPIERYLALEGIAQARAGHISQAKEALSQLLEIDRPLADETKRLLLSAPEASNKSFREFVEESIPKQLSQDSASLPRRQRRRRMPLIGTAVILIFLLAGVIIIFVWPTESEIVAPSRTIAERVIESVSGEPDAVSSASDLEQYYAQMQQVVCKVIVRIEVLQDDGHTVWIPISHGTGFVASRDGLILTNRHVVETGPEYLHDYSIVVGWDIQTVFGPVEKPLIIKAEITQQSTSVDLAWIRVKHKFEKALAFASTPSPGQKVFAYGFPGVAEDVTESINEGDTKKRDAAIKAKIDSGEQPDLMEWLGKDGLTITVTSGIVSAIRKTEEGLMLQTDTFIHGGNSGGPLVDEQRRVVGIVTLKSSRVESTNFCIAGSTIYEELARMTGITWPDSW
ncbi:MAG: trypsin-like peptidase domain-containing protein [Planctomycetes bacterium]|nr:trypsin-like peptidase domain-containing protein [Planctomycetota bacterium]